MVAYMVYKSMSSTASTFLGKWGATLAVALGSVLTVLDPTRHVLLDHGGVFFPEEALSMYAEYPKLSPIGRFCQLSTITGLSLVTLGVIFFLRLPEKLCGVKMA
mmetsp:Transcript_60556/g.131240  ORF Transcript_60556/g.131240 Transcript_60556/m.131240 type:complete len:104 (-) Transcript_60556:564-875(-)